MNNIAKTTQYIIKGIFDLDFNEPMSAATTSINRALARIGWSKNNLTNRYGVIITVPATANIFRTNIFFILLDLLYQIAIPEHKILYSQISAPIPCSRMSSLVANQASNSSGF